VRYHLDMRALNRPTSWWGWSWDPPIPMSITELIAAGNMDSRVAALFWVAMERGASMIVAADPPHSGKTTTVSALLSFTRPDTAVYFTCGEGETFALPAPSPSYDTYILVNEMSDHIPVYTWDDNARRVFEGLAEGYRLATTMHDTTVEGVLAQLERDLSIPKAHLAHLTFVVPMFIGQLGGRLVRRIEEIAFLQPKGNTYSITRIVDWDRQSDTFSLFGDDAGRVDFAVWAKLSSDALDEQIKDRAGFLDALRKTGANSPEDVGAAIESYYQQMLRA
jgi:hypothetical protein